MTSIAEDIAPRIAIQDPIPVEDELAAMQAIVATFDRLDGPACNRVLAWAKDRYKWADSNADKLFTDFLTQLLEAIHEHQKASLKQPRHADRELWDATIKGSKFWTDPPAPNRSSSGE